MSFTDEQLANLKERQKEIGSGYMDSGTITALLVRLEAAERVAAYTEKYAPRVTELQELIKAWRKSAGK